MKPLRNLAFTLIELLVVISIIGILAALAIPAVSGALVKGQLTASLNNARQLQLATFNLNLERESIGELGAWPGAAGVSVSSSFTAFINELTNALTVNDIRKMFSAPGVSIPGSALPASATEVAFNIYQVGNVDEGSVIFLTTKNWDAASPLVAPLSTARPFGDKGVVVMRKGGDGQVFQSRFVTNTNSLGWLPIQIQAPKFQ